jgi:hypothetical protein
VGAVGEQVKIQTLQALDPKAYDAITGEMDLSRVMPGALAAGTKVAAHVVAQGPGAIVQGALNTGRAMADGTEAAAGAIVDGGAYLAGNAMHQVRNGLGVPGGHEAGIAAVEGGRANRAAQEARTMDAGEMLGWASDRVGDFNNGVGALVDGTVGSMADAARLYATGDVVLGMDTQELKDAGYGSIAATQERLEAASSELNANPPFQAPSLPASPQEALQRITPR